MTRRVDFTPSVVGSELESSFGCLEQKRWDKPSIEPPEALSMAKSGGRM